MEGSVCGGEEVEAAAAEVVEVMMVEAEISRLVERRPVSEGMAGFSKS